MTPSRIRYRIESGAWVRIFTGVYRVATSPVSPEQRLQAAVLAAGRAVVSGRSAGHLWGLCDAPARPEIATIRRPRTITGVATVHRVTTLPHRTRRKGGFDVTDPTQTIIDLAAALATDELEDALDEALRLGLTSVPTIESRLAAIGTSGRRGTRVLKAALAERADGRSTQSRLERRLLRWLRDEGLPDPIRQLAVEGGDGFAARPDFVYPDARLAIEAEGYRYHAGKAAWTRDLARRNRLVASGYEIVHVTREQIDAKDGAVIELIRKKLAPTRLL